MGHAPAVLLMWAKLLTPTAPAKSRATGAAIIHRRSNEIADKLSRTVASLFCLPWRLAPDRLVMSRSPTTPPVRISSLHRGHNHSHSHSHSRYASPDIWSGRRQAPFRAHRAHAAARSRCRALPPDRILRYKTHK